MSDASSGNELVPIQVGALTAPAPAPDAAAMPAPGPARSPFERPLAAFRRYKFLMLGVLGLAAAGGFAAARFIKPQYEVRATIWIEPDNPLSDRTGPIRPTELLKDNAWVELLKSYRIADAVVRKLTLYVKPNDPADSTLFRGFTLADRFVPGSYELRMDPASKRWHLSLQAANVADSGVVTDSVGKRFGFKWQLESAAFRGQGERKVAFTVSTPRETSLEVMDKLDARLPENSNFLWLQYTDDNSQLAARTLNTWLNEYTAVALELKTKNTSEFAKILSGQLQFAETSLHDAETALESFRVKTITLPSEGTPVAAGVEVQNLQNPALNSFFQQKIQYDDLRHDRVALQKTIDSARAGSVPYEAVLLIPSVASSPAGEALRNAFKDLYDQQAKLAAARVVYTDNFQTVRDLKDHISTIQNQTIPQLSNQLLAQLTQRESDYQGRISGDEQDLEKIPARTIEEMRLRRAVSVAEGLYGTLKSRYAEAQLAAESATPDVTVLDSAVAPLRPTKNTTGRFMVIALLAGLGAAIGLALLLDAMDGRVRYPEQVMSEMGLPIAGTIPRLPRRGVNPDSPEQVSQFVESIRSVRMFVRHAVADRPLLAISSASPGDGKSLTAANLAMSFAESGLRTVLVDGDTRRGGLHDAFGISNTNGLTDYLLRLADAAAVVHSTAYENLSLVPSGIRSAKSPELLTTPVLGELVAFLRQSFDVVIFDTPPLSAGIDGYAIGSATGAMLLVVRIGQTERRMAAAKLVIADRLPIHVIGAVLNGVRLEGAYQYYAYAKGYDVQQPAIAGKIA